METSQFSYRNIPKSSEKTQLYQIFDEDISNYMLEFVQPNARFGVRTDAWHLLSDKNCGNVPVRDHLQGRIRIGLPAQFYVKRSFLDIDDISTSHLNQLLFSDLGFVQEQVIIQQTSENSYHIILCPTYNGKVMTLALYEAIMPQIIKHYEEIYHKNKWLTELKSYPKKGRILQAPFHPNLIVTYCGEICSDLESRMLALKNQKTLELKNFVKLHNIVKATNAYHGPSQSSRVQNGQQIFKSGLSGSGRRNEEIFDATLYAKHKLRLSGNSLRKAIHDLLDHKNNGVSKDYNRNPSKTHQLVDLAVDYVDQMPTGKNKTGSGLLFSEVGFEMAIKHCGANFANFKNLSHIIACSTAYQQIRFQVHHQNLMKWFGRPDSVTHSDRSYLNQINKLIVLGVINREEFYSKQRGITKTLHLLVIHKHEIPNPQMAFVDNNGDPCDFESALSQFVNQIGVKSFRQLLIENGFDKSKISHYLKNHHL